MSDNQLRAELAEVRVEIANLASVVRNEMRYQARCFAMALLGSVTLMAAILRIG